MKVFISYSLLDRKRVEEITRILDIFGISYWLDSNEIKHGESITEKISQGLEICEVMLLFLSKHPSKSRWVNKEWSALVAYEISRGTKRIIPVLLDDVEVPILLTDKKYIDARRDLRELFSYVSSILAYKNPYKISHSHVGVFSELFDSCLTGQLDHQDAIMALYSFYQSINKRECPFASNLVGSWLSTEGWCEGQILTIREEAFFVAGVGAYGSCCAQFPYGTRDGVISVIRRVTEDSYVFSWWQEVGAGMSGGTDSGVGVLWHPTNVNDRYELLYGLWFYEDFKFATKSSKKGKLYRWVMKRYVSVQ